jgi:hypothetical protein
MQTNIPGNSNSRMRLPERRSCSSSFTSRSRAQYFSCSGSAFQCSSLQCVGQPQSGHSNLTVFTGFGFGRNGPFSSSFSRSVSVCSAAFLFSLLLPCPCVCPCSCPCSDEHTGHGAICEMASPRARIAGNGDLENGWNRSSWLNTGTGWGGGAGLLSLPVSRLKRLNIGRLGVRDATPFGPCCPSA